ncbi:MAG: hypothetical protein C4524_08645 [Candidatus Zixiibacteriota bacterium]|nr:MAG: hypothetical protein C4524_08645 [candidate division Zixibacteria bacterium]
MFTTLAEFEAVWTQESGNTRKILGALTDASLSREVSPRDRTLGRMAWHLACAIPEMARMIGLQVSGPEPDSLPPARAAEIFEAYDQASHSLLEQIRAHWTDETLKVEDDLYGERWSRAQTLAVVMVHEIHHRGQMTVLMRQAGLTVPGVYGPAREEWAAYGRPEPPV